ncbi:hypothetical protein ACOV1W_12535 [Paraclostridium bifermentans]|uniref:hypothetical protein n=1 Tax=Paraclostridium bifermentans TaxID=1490 RepID=UPI003D280149
MSKVNRGNNDKSRLCRFGYVDYIVLASSLAIAVAEEVGPTDLSILASFFATFSDELALIASVKQGCSPDSDSDSSEEITFVPPIPATSGSRSKPKIKKRKKIKKYKKV